MLNLSRILLLLLLPLCAVAQLCDQCAGAEACFGSGPCAACDASVNCTGTCEGCATAGPCRSCFETEETEEPWPWPVQVSELPCDYSVDKAEVTLVRGEIPAWLEGTFYHAQHTNSTHNNYDGNLANPSGILAIKFGAGETPVASFDLAKGSGWQEQCDSVTPPFIMDCVVTVNQFGTPGAIASVCAGGNLVQFATDDSGTVEFNGILELTWKNESLEDTWPYGEECAGFCPQNLQPEHMPSDSNGDVYSLYYTMEPAGYRVFKLPKGSLEREEIAWVESVRDTPSYTHMGPVPTANYIIIVEPPLPLDGDYDWAEFHSSFDSTAPVTIYVIEKDSTSGNVIAQYTADETYWTWHVANAWEDCETGEVMLDVTRDPNAHSFKSFYNSTPGDFGESTLTRITLPDPRTAGLDAVASTTILDTAGFAIEFPVTQDQYQFAGKTGHYWMAGSGAGNDLAFPLSMNAIVKHDVTTGEALDTYEPEGLYVGEPYFVPRTKDQGAMRDDGAIVVIAMNATGNLFGAVLNASNLEELALFEIPMAPVPTFGLHSYYSTVSTWVSTAESCDGESSSTNGTPDGSGDEGAISEPDADSSTSGAVKKLLTASASIGALLALSLW
ncbi:carotene 9',10'-oxygenase [Seminavis robusta]|uniref:Carotene 9',10'-oxygenase n=1 Tax=Seminavis robusta TaxID=568900 RepID=A0A9N8E1Y5_9STRA|nr:carotene 9',10'-oxygenase [Seminavis robusta]|eukprot:Sro538_g162510.1 carotene 9',10'-oxygenase (614) ;mRNA; f:10334-12349